jgi:hypothetical protein
MKMFQSSLPIWIFGKFSGWRDGGKTKSRQFVDFWVVDDEMMKGAATCKLYERIRFT